MLDANTKTLTQKNTQSMTGHFSGNAKKMREITSRQALIIKIILCFARVTAITRQSKFAGVGWKAGTFREVDADNG
ncbi:hypothetical protein [Nostoc sp.]|uniref:hypothetical protein n=1 Tax=Nostoc sp. TaxID=1180 RepID=UPI002FF91538